MVNDPFQHTTDNDTSTFILHEYSKLCSFIEEWQKGEERIKRTLYREQGDRANVVSRLDEENEHYGTVFTNIPRGYSLLCQCYTMLKTPVLSSSHLLALGRIEKIFKQLHHSVARNLLYSLDDLEIFKEPKEKRWELLKEDAKEIASQWMHTLENEKEVFFPFSNDQHLSIVKFSKEDMDYYYTTYDAGGRTVEVSQEERLQYQEKRGNRWLSPAAKIVYGTAKRVILQPSAENIFLLMVQALSPRVEKFYNENIAPAENKRKNYNHVLNRAINPEALLGPIIKESSLAVLSQTVGNCPTRSIREMLRGNLPEELFASFDHFIATATFESLREELHLKKEELEHTLKRKNIPFAYPLEQEESHSGYLGWETFTPDIQKWFPYYPFTQQVQEILEAEFTQVIKEINPYIALPHMLYPLTKNTYSNLLSQRLRDFCFEAWSVPFQASLIAMLGADLHKWLNKKYQAPSECHIPLYSLLKVIFNAPNAFMPGNQERVEKGLKVILSEMLEKKEIICTVESLEANQEVIITRYYQYTEKEKYSAALTALFDATEPSPSPKRSKVMTLNYRHDPHPMFRNTNIIH